jgi:hypothetical protein
LQRLQLPVLLRQLARLLLARKQRQQQLELPQLERLLAVPLSGQELEPSILAFKAEMF